MKRLATRSRPVVERRNSDQQSRQARGDIARQTTQPADIATLLSRGEQSGHRPDRLSLRADGAGTELPSDVRQKMEDAFSQDFSRVRVHSAPGLVAPAFTTQNDVYFRPGQFDPHSREGQSLLGHELAHVVQQSSGQVPSAPSVASEMGLESHADQAGRQAANGKPVQFKGCEICGETSHRAKNCPKKQQKKEIGRKAKEFNAAKKETISKLDERSPATGAFSHKHVKESGTTLAKTSEKVAKTRTWGGGRESGRSTVTAMSPQDLADERRYAVEGLKMKESTVTPEGTVAANMGVNKPTKFAYKTQSANVQSTGEGTRQVAEEGEELAKPVLGLRGDEVHHLEGVEKEDL